MQQGTHGKFLFPKGFEWTVCLLHHLTWLSVCVSVDSTGGRPCQQMCAYTLPLKEENGNLLVVPSVEGRWRNEEGLGHRVSQWFWLDAWPCHHCPFLGMFLVLEWVANQWCLCKNQDWCLEGFWRVVMCLTWLLMHVCQIQSCVMNQNWMTQAAGGQPTLQLRNEKGRHNEVAGP